MADTPGDDRTLRSEEHHVDVQEAENVFNELSRALSRRSDHDRDLKGTVTNSSGNDVEKAALEEEESFDLREYLTSSNDANQSAGIKHKHVGVTWEDLQVEVPGGGDYKVRAALFVGFLNRYSFKAVIRFILDRLAVRPINGWFSSSV